MVKFTRQLIINENFTGFDNEVRVLGQVFQQKKDFIDL